MARAARGPPEDRPPAPDLRRLDAARLRAPRRAPGLSAAPARPGCYTTGRWTGAGVRHGARVAARLVRDAEQLGVGTLDPAACLVALEEAGRSAFGREAGVVRLEARAGEGGARLEASVRPLGPEPGHWSAVVAPEPHDGPGPFAGAKRTGWTCVDAARTAALAAGADEALLLDAAGRVVDGARSCLVVVRADGSAAAPPLARGGVRGVAREIALAAAPEIREADLTLADLAAAREIVALNAVRGARPIVRLSARPVGTGVPGAWAARLREMLEGGP